MALGTCRECGQSVSKSAPTCPRCGAGTPVRRTSWIAWLALGVLALVLLRLCRTGDQPAPAASLASPSTAPLPKLTAAKLRADYKANQVAADAKYQGQRFEVSGTVVNIRSGLGDEPQVWLVSELDPVLAEGLRKSFARTLSKGDTMISECTVKGVFADMPHLDCAPR
jgi:hypothetical protein